MQDLQDTDMDLPRWNVRREGEGFHLSIATADGAVVTARLELQEAADMGQALIYLATSE